MKGSGNSFLIQAKELWVLYHRYAELFRITEAGLRCFDNPYRNDLSYRILAVIQSRMRRALSYRLAGKEKPPESKQYEREDAPGEQGERNHADKRRPKMLTELQLHMRNASNFPSTPAGHKRKRKINRLRSVQAQYATGSTTSSRICANG